MHPTHDRTALTASQEDYLEAIFQLLETKPVARAKDIATRLQVKAASVTGALRQLASQGCIDYAPYDFITLTDHGRRLAADVVTRHALLNDFLTRVLAIPASEAEAGACRLEHALPPSIQQRLLRFVAFMDACPRDTGGLHERFQYFLDYGQLPESCAACAAQAKPACRTPAPPAAASGRGVARAVNKRPQMRKTVS